MWHDDRRIASGFGEIIFFHRAPLRLGNANVGTGGIRAGLPFGNFRGAAIVQER